ncbi:RpiR family transcriptional regulator [Rhizobium sp. Leaf384]|uniref:MurR/RpiR family transcriptional regulator n=1 Tax=unclassified Rhizobium TaxID=2613769 RepID=UPI0007157CC0|nr:MULTISPECIES: MurR/RpiR family transcriptional regulator [unclassified Rhizobium]KQR69395.1 RpiR family transcriptional regulator [Rhizobium sp. Leaf341]KQS74064.1 RpiR family transcriptional regulator [Rhizobium sp. Leaf384]KQS84795.1 RpiR family transcriptional regulator [Rhizobium sp. Leaf383]
MDIFTTLQEGRAQFSPSEQRIADILLGDFEFAVNASIIELAERAEVSPPTVTRFCRNVGCQSFSDFKVKLAKTAFVGVRYLNPEAKSTEPADVAEDVITKAQNALFMMHRALDPVVLDKVADRLSRAEMVYTFGSGGNSSMIATEMQNRLFRLGSRVTASNDHNMQLMLTAAARTNDVIVGSSFSGRNQDLARCFGLARESGITTIALTQTDSPVAQAAELVIGIDLPEGANIFRPTSTRFAFLAVVDVIASLVAYRNRKLSTVTLRHIKQQLVEHRDGDDRQILGD